MEQIIWTIVGFIALAIVAYLITRPKYRVRASMGGFHIEENLGFGMYCAVKFSFDRDSAIKYVNMLIEENKQSPIYFK